MLLRIFDQSGQVEIMYKSLADVHADFESLWKQYSNSTKWELVTIR
jgi:hypothetical protein